METLDLGNGQFTIQALEKLITMLQQNREVTVHILNCAPETPSLLTLGATLSRWAENERTPGPGQINQAMKHLKSGFCICGEAKERMVPFCLECYQKVPDDLKRKIGLVLKDKFVNNYLKARDLLRPAPKDVIFSDNKNPVKYDGEMLSGIAKATDGVMAKHNV